MTASRAIPAMFALLLPLGGCDQYSLGGTKTAALEERLAKAETQIASDSTEIASLKDQVKQLKQRRELDEFFSDIDKIAYLTPGADGYSTIAFDLGVLTMQLSNVMPYANGSKVELRIGNTLSSAISGLKATVEWGKVNEKNVPIKDTTKSKEMTFIQVLRGGAWTIIPIVLEGVPPAELGFVRVTKVSSSSIQLTK